MDNKELSKLKTPGARFKYFRKLKEHSLEQAAPKIGCSPQTLSKFENNRHSKGTSFILALAKYCSVTPEFLLTGKQSYQVQTVYGGKVRTLSDQKKTPLLAHFVTPISWEEAASTVRFADDVAYREDREYNDPIPRPLKGGFQCIALRMQGNSMTCKGNALNFTNADILIFDPEKNPNSGDFVLARIISEKSAIFRQYVNDCGDICLVPLNPSYPTIKLTGDVKIIGKLIERKTIF